MQVLCLLFAFALPIWIAPCMATGFRPSESSKYTCNVKIIRSSLIPDKRQQNQTRVAKLIAKWTNPHYRNNLGLFHNLVHRTLNMVLLDMPYSAYNSRHFNETDPSHMNSQPQVLDYSGQLLLDYSVLSEIIPHLQNRPPFGNFKKHYMRHCDHERALRAMLFDPLKIEREFMVLSHLTNIAIYGSVCRFASLFPDRYASLLEKCMIYWIMYGETSRSTPDIDFKWAVDTTVETPDNVSSTQQTTIKSTTENFNIPSFTTAPNLQPSICGASPVVNCNCNCNYHRN